jgi:pimeloyl-ACP methyl ester carboxylesterase
VAVDLAFSEYGDPKGKTVIYFHGAPGGPEECSIFDIHARQHGLRLVCYDRFSIDSRLKEDAYYKYLADVIVANTSGEKVDLVGFSIGCHVAINTSLYLGDSVGKLHLVSAGAPLDGDDFLPDMAGKTVFSIAMKYPIMFTLLSHWQALLSKLAPRALFKMLFASATAQDKVLSKTTKFQEYMLPILSYCFSANLRGYIREISQYVTPWKASVFNCNSATHIWHGLNDNWSPVAMAKYLDENLSNSSTITIFDGLSHYSCLNAAVSEICAQLAEA